MNDLDEKLLRSEIQCMTMRVIYSLKDDSGYSKEDAAEDLMEMLEYLCLD